MRQRPEDNTESLTERLLDKVVISSDQNEFRKLNQQERANYYIAFKVIAKAIQASSLFGKNPSIELIDRIVLKDQESIENGTTVKMPSSINAKYGDLDKDEPTSFDLTISPIYIRWAISNYENYSDSLTSLAGLFISILHEIEHIDQALDLPDIHRSAMAASHLVLNAKDSIRRNIFYIFRYLNNPGELHAWEVAFKDALRYLKQPASDKIDQYIIDKLSLIIQEIQRQNKEDLLAPEEYINRFLNDSSNQISDQVKNELRIFLGIYEAGLLNYDVQPDQLARLKSLV